MFMNCVEVLGCVLYLDTFENPLALGYFRVESHFDGCLRLAVCRRVLRNSKFLCPQLSLR